MVDHDYYKDLNIELYNYRLKNGLSQADIGEQLGVSQVQVSRIEKGAVSISDSLAVRIQKLIKKPLLAYEFDLSSVQEDKWTIATFNYPNKHSGDVVHINSKSVADKICTFHVDAAGSDLIASINADYVRLAVEACLADAGPSVYPENLYLRLNKIYRNTKDFWRGEPSINIIFANSFVDRVDILNAGMPDILKFSVGGESIQPIAKKRFPPVGLLPLREYAYSTSINMSKGDVLFSFSDGFIETFNRVTQIKLDLLLSSLAKAHKGDAEGVGWKLLKTLGDFVKGKPIGDDISFAIISKR